MRQSTTTKLIARCRALRIPEENIVGSDTDLARLIRERLVAFVGPQLRERRIRVGSIVRVSSTARTLVVLALGVELVVQAVGEVYYPVTCPVAIETAEGLVCQLECLYSPEDGYTHEMVVLRESNDNEEVLEFILSEITEEDLRETPYGKYLRRAAVERIRGYETA